MTDPIVIPQRPTVLGPGRHMWLWPKGGWAKLDPGRIAADLRTLGCVGIIPQCGLEVDWAASAVPVFEAAGIRVSLGLGLDGGSTRAQISHAILDGIERIGRVMLDWESERKWESLGGRAMMNGIADDVLARVPDAPLHVVDCPWPEPLRAMPELGGGETHPSAPLRESGRIARERYAQVYGQPHAGRSRALLAWARSATQYPAIGPFAVYPAYQTYAGVLQDCIEELLQEPDAALWDYVELDPVYRFALMTVVALEGAGFPGVGAIAAFQAAHGGLTVDGLIGPKTLGALGLGP